MGVTRVEQVAELRRDGLLPREIAEALRIRRSTVSTYLSLARERGIDAPLAPVGRLAHRARDAERRGTA